MGYEKTDCIEQFHNAFLRKITNLRRSTPLYMLHAQLGRYSLKINIKMRMISFWLSLVNQKSSRLSNITYKVLLSNFNSGFYQHKWIHQIKLILKSVGRNDLWVANAVLNPNAVKQSIRRTLLDQSIQNSSPRQKVRIIDFTKPALSLKSI